MNGGVDEHLSRSKSIVESFDIRSKGGSGADYRFTHKRHVIFCIPWQRERWWEKIKDREIETMKDMPKAWPEEEGTSGTLEDQLLRSGRKSENPWLSGWIQDRKRKGRNKIFREATAIWYCTCYANRSLAQSHNALDYEDQVSAIGLRDKNHRALNINL